MRRPGPSIGEKVNFETPLLCGRFVRRYKRFFADIVLASGEEITAHTPNTGTLLTCTEPDSRAYVSLSDNPKRKLKYTWEIAEAGGVLVGVHTGRANGLAQEAVEAGVIPELSGYESLRREVKYGRNSRIDLLLESPRRPPCYVEVKNVTLGRGGRALFPDAVTARGTKHLNELMDVVARGERAAMLFVVQREDCRVMEPADDIDPLYGRTLREAAAAGVELLAYRARVSPRELRLERPLPVVLP